MNCPQWEERLTDFVDGSSATSDALAVEQHLLVCPDCREETAGLRSVLRAAALLPRRIEPGRDLWRGIESDLRRPLAGRLWPGMAAAMLIFVAAAAVTSTLWRAAPPGPGAPVPLAAAPDLRAAEEEFRRATVQLMAALERRKADLSPQTIADLEESLRVVNQAIAETGAALARDPTNHRLGCLLTDIYATKVDLLSNAVRIPGAA